MDNDHAQAERLMHAPIDPATRDAIESLGPTLEVCLEKVRIEFFGHIFFDSVKAVGA